MGRVELLVRVRLIGIRIIGLIDRFRKVLGVLPVLEKVRLPLEFALAKVMVASLVLVLVIVVPEVARDRISVPLTFATVVPATVPAPDTVSVPPPLVMVVPPTVPAPDTVSAPLPSTTLVPAPVPVRDKFCEPPLMVRVLPLVPEPAPDTVIVLPLAIGSVPMLRIVFDWLAAPAPAVLSSAEEELNVPPSVLADRATDDGDLTRAGVAMTA